MPELNANGVRLFYEDLGDPAASRVIGFLNGVMASASSWNGISAPLIEMGYRVVLHDFKGQLKSEKPHGVYTFDEHAAEARALYKHLGIKKLHLVGTSYGGEAAMRFAMLFPEMTESITVIASVSELDEVCCGFVENWKILCGLYDGEAFMKAAAPTLYAPDFMRNNREFISKRAAAMKAVPADYFDGQKILYDTFLTDVTMTDRLKTILCPALIISAEHDILKPPRFSKIIAENIPGSLHLLIPDCGHVAIIEKPKEILTALLGFL
ncbi:MAG: alpha/beta hydrolase [Defluviitaleaceae bacterium]|nr:alpha/beta hydrolase [Defluviitaleaceae bacterium]